MTVRQVADYLQLSTMMVYKLAQKGSLPSAKIGSVWRFEQEAIDQWLKAKTVEPTAAESPFMKTAKEAVADFVSELKKKYGKKLSQVFIYGSYARGEATPDSDVDLFVVLKEPFDYWKEWNKISDISYAVSFGKERLVVMSTLLRSEKEFQEGNTPLLSNIRREGKKAA